MERTFTGEHRHKVDGKGRVSVPSQFRRVLEANDPNVAAGLPPTVVLQYGNSSQKFLRGLTVAGWKATTARIDLMPNSARKRTLQRMFTAKVNSISIDETGRLVLSAQLRESAGITDTAIFIAMGDTFQIVSPATYDEMEAEFEAEIAELPDDVDPLDWLDMDSGAGAEA